jgi:bacillithiol biosynthesis cysteine-adding enzyme BshC
MDQPANYLRYQSTGYFSKIVTDYLSRAASLRQFYVHLPDIDGIKQAIEARRAFATPRKLLAGSLEQQYAGLSLSSHVKANIEALADENSFTITTAHQPNIFTGPLYFIYKILHTIRLAAELQERLPGNRFIPVYYMGSEDADLEELGNITVGGRKLVWETKQTGAVGRMKVDKALIKLIHEIYGQTGVQPFGAELHTIFQNCYTEGKTIQQATLELVNDLFGDYGLVVLIPDNAQLKKAFQPVVEKELLEGFSHVAVNDTIASLAAADYKVQAGGRDINLFYLTENKRERIELHNDQYLVQALGLSFSKDEILKELAGHPERFSANVILRGAFQETILPNIAFIGGGGELAYWLELKQVFAAVQIPYPVLILRNSLMLVRHEQAVMIGKLGFGMEDLFLDQQTLLNKLVHRDSLQQLSLDKERASMHALYEQLKTIAQNIDGSLTDHVAALEIKADKKLAELQKKLLRAERNKFSAQQQQIAKLKQELFPANSLQERVDNFSLYYAKEGRGWLDKVYKASTAFNDGFGVVVDREA